MADSGASEAPSIDFRIYLGMILFRWQLITVCFLYGLLVGVVFLQITPKKHITYVQIRAEVDQNLKIDVQSPWGKIDRHRRMLESMQARNEAIEKLAPEWGEKLGDKRNMYLALEFKNVSAYTLRVSIKSEYPRYAEALLAEMVKIHEQISESARASGVSQSTSILQRELDDMEERIRKAESDIFEYERLNDIRRVQLRAEQEDSYIGTLVSQRRSLRTAMWMMEVQFPALRDADIGVLNAVSAYQLTSEGKLVLSARNGPGDAFVAESINMALEDKSAAAATAGNATGSTSAGTGVAAVPGTPDSVEGARTGSPAERGLGWQDTRYKLIILEAQEREMAQMLTGDHPRLKQLRTQIATLREQLRMTAELQFRNLMDAYRGMQIMQDALEAAEYKWQSVNWQQAQKMAELQRLQERLSRYEHNYQTLYQRLQDVIITEEMKAERFTAGTPVSSQRPVWPDATRVLMLALGIGLGLGGGLAVLTQIFDNKVQLSLIHI